MPEHQSLSLADGMRQTRMTYPRLWMLYLTLGGAGTQADVQHHVESGDCPDDHEHNVLAQALNDAYLEAGHDHPVAYRHLHPPPALP